MSTLEKRGNLFILTLTGEDEHRLNPNLIESIRSNLAQVKSEATRGCALITISHGKFFSNGFDVAWTQAAGSKSEAQKRFFHLIDIFKPLVADLLSLPLPTIASVTGHASAAGFILATSHDYVLMRRDRAVLYMAELDIGLAMPDYFISLLRSKIGSPGGLRNVILGAAKVNGEEGVKIGLVHSAHDSAESTVDAAMRMGGQLAGRKWIGEVYAELRKALYPELRGLLGLGDGVSSKL